MIRARLLALHSLRLVLLILLFLLRIKSGTFAQVYNFFIPKLITTLLNIKPTSGRCVISSVTSMIFCTIFPLIDFMNHMILVTSYLAFLAWWWMMYLCSMFWWYSVGLRCWFRMDTLISVMTLLFALEYSFMNRLFHVFVYECLIIRSLEFTFGPEFLLCRWFLCDYRAGSIEIFANSF